MACVVWEERFNIGIKDIDDQHKLFVGYLNDLHDAMQAGNAEAIVAPILYRLFDYITIHFAAEEKILESIHYPEFEKHVKQHAHFILELNFLDNSQTAGNMLPLLRGWFINHITTEDIKYAGYLK